MALGAREGRLPLDERRQLPLEHGEAACLRARCRRVGAGERGGKRGAQHDAEGCDVVLCHPLTDREQCGIDHRRRVGGRDERLGRHAVAPGAVAHDESHLLAAAHGNHHAAADGYAFGEVVRDRIGERLVEREREGDRDEHELPGY